MHKKHIYAGLLALSSLASAPAFAASVVNFTFDAGTNVLVNGHDVAAHPDISNISAWSVRDGVSVDNGLTGKPNTGRALGGRNFGTGGVGDPEGNEFRVSFDVIGSLSLDSFSFWEQGSSGPNGLGPVSWILFINDINVGSGSATQGNGGQDHSGGLNLSDLTGTVNVRVFATGAANDATATWRIDNFALEGTVAPVPLPASLPMLVGALGLLGVARRRRA